MMKGNLTRGQVIDALPWFTNIVVKQLPGQTILDALEFGVSQLPKESGGFLQVSGLTYEVDTRLNSSVLADESGMFLNITGKRKVSNVKVNGKDLNLTKLNLSNYQLLDITHLLIHRGYYFSRDLMKLFYKQYL